MIEKDKFLADAAHILAQNGLACYIKDGVLEKFYKLTEYLLTQNEHMNLTAIRDVHGVIVKHYADSLLAASEVYLPAGASIIDVGCGAGFPSFPFAIARPDVTILSVDSTAKKVAYVEDCAAFLGLTNLTAQVMRAEDGAAVGSPLRERFDVACARAVAALPVLCELCLPYVKPGGRFLALKAKTAEEEWQAARGAVTTLGGRLGAMDRCFLQDGETSEVRHLIRIDKVRPTPGKYPRAYAQIVKKPL